MAAPKHAHAQASHSDDLHYDKDALIHEYTHTYGLIMKVLGVFVVLVVLYFMGLVVYLGGFSHTKHDPWVKQFGERIEIEYDGLKLTDPKPDAHHGAAQE